MVDIRSLAGNPYDGHTLDEQLEQANIVSGVDTKTVGVDLGYRGRHETKQRFHRIASESCCHERR